MVKFARCRSGNFALIFALMAPLLIGLVGAAVDFLSFQRQQAAMQNIVDEVALAAAKEATIKNWSQSAVEAVAESYVSANLRKINSTSGESYMVSAALDKQGKSITVTLDMNQYRYFLLGYFRHDPQIRVEAKATVSGDMPICVVGLEKSVDDMLVLKDEAGLLADKCAVYGNSLATKAIFVDKKASLDAGYTCSAGGFDGSLSSFKPAPTTDCPPIGDPLASRPAPVFGACDHTDFSVKNGTFTIDPGVYCGGLLIDNKANVVMKPGIYVIKGGEFRIRNSGSLLGDGVGIYFTGTDGRAVFDGTSSISLTAPVDGEMAGLLFYQDRVMDMTEFEISSKNASVLLGTIYLPNGRLKVHANNAVAQSSAFTVIVARFLDIGKKAKLYINSGYASTDVPVPEGVGPNSKVRLSN